MSLKSRLLEKSKKNLKKEKLKEDVAEVIEVSAFTSANKFNIVEYFENHPDIDSLSIYSFDKVFVQKAGVTEESDLIFKDNDEVRKIIDILSNEYDVIINSQSPSFSVSLGNRIKISAIVPPMIKEGAFISLKRIGKSSGLNSLNGDNRFASNEISLFLKECLKKNLNIFIAGNNNVDKFSALNYIASLIPQEESIVTIEAVPQLKLKQNCTINLVKYKNAFAKIIKKAMNLKQDKIIIADARIEELQAIYEAIISGTTGIVTSISVKSYDDLIPSLQNLILLNTPNFNVENANSLISTAIDIVVYIDKTKDGNVKITSISEFSNSKAGLTLQELFVWEEPKLKSQSSEGSHASLDIKSKFFNKENFYSMGFMEEYFAKAHKHSYMTKSASNTKPKVAPSAEKAKIEKQIAKYKSLKEKLKSHS